MMKTFIEQKSDLKRQIEDLERRNQALYDEIDRNELEISKLQKKVEELEIKYRDLGPKEYNLDDDYPDFAFKVAEKVAKKPDEDWGILICGTGQGMMRAANKVKGIRAVLAWDEYTAEIAKAHDNSNILTLGGGVTPLKTAKKIVAVWLSTGFSRDERHKRRLRKIDKK